MTEPGDKESASRGRGGLRASHAEREQVADALRTAFVHGRLTTDELGARAEQVYAAKTHAELAGIVADIPTEFAGARSKRRPWRATKRAWWFDYAAILPGIAALIFLPAGPHVTIWTFVIWAAVLYPVFWVLGAVTVHASRRAMPSGGPPSQPLSWYQREQAAQTLKAAREQGRLTEEEFGERSARASEARSAAELDAVTADLPSGLTDRLPKSKDAWAAASVTIAAAGALAAIIATQPDNEGAFLAGMAAAFTVLLTPAVTVGLIADARHQRRARGKLRLELE